MKLYKFLSGARLLKTYTSKFMLIAFVGIHLPLFGVIGILITSAGGPINKAALFLLALGLTLLSTIVTLAILSALIMPLKTAQTALSNFLRTRTIPSLPNEFTDETGLLMRDINTVVSLLNDNANKKDEVIKALSYDLRTLATNILALLQLIEDGTDPAETANYMKRIRQSVDRQIRLMDATVNNYEHKIKA